MSWSVTNHSHKKSHKWCFSPDPFRAFSQLGDPDSQFPPLCSPGTRPAVTESSSESVWGGDSLWKGTFGTLSVPAFITCPLATTLTDLSWSLIVSAQSPQWLCICHYRPCPIYLHISSVHVVCWINPSVSAEPFGTTPLRKKESTPRRETEGEVRWALHSDGESLASDTPTTPMQC